MVRVKWQSKSDGSGDVASVVARSLMGSCASNTTAATYQITTCDLRVMASEVITVSAGGVYDSMTGLTSVATMRYVRIGFDIVDSTGIGAVLAD